MKDFLVRERVTAGQIAVLKEGKLLMTHAFGAAPPKGYAPVNTKTLFRLASNTKAFTCAAVNALRLQGRLAMDARAFPLLGIDGSVRKAKDKRVDDITIQDLINHAGGWNDHEDVRATDGQMVAGTRQDPMFLTRQIALELGLTRAATPHEIAEYVYGERLQFAPGTQTFQTTGGKSYSNFGYMLLGLVVEKVTGQRYANFVRTGMGIGMDLSAVFLAHTQQSEHMPQEVWYDASGEGLSQLQPRSDAHLPNAYGGSFVVEQHLSGGGLMTNAETLAMFASKSAIWGIGSRAPGSTRTGSLPGTSSYATSRRNAVDCAMVVNTREFHNGKQAWETFQTALNWLLAEL